MNLRGSRIPPRLTSLIPDGPNPLFGPPNTPEGVVISGEPPFVVVVAGVPLTVVTGVVEAELENQQQKVIGL